MAEKNIDISVITKHTFATHKLFKKILRQNNFEKINYNIKMADKGAGSVRAGINLIKSKPLFITKASVNGLKEIKSYSWKEKDGKPIDEVVKVNDDFMDSFRYAIYSNHKKVVPRFR